MPTPDMMDDFYAYNDWANEKVLGLCDGLTDEQLDALFDAKELSPSSPM